MDESSRLRRLKQGTIGKSTNAERRLDFSFQRENTQEVEQARRRARSGGYVVKNNT